MLRRGDRVTRAVALLLVALVVAPAAAAQIGAGGTLSNPVTGKYTETYVVTGRVMDALGEPASAAEVLVELDMRGVTGASVRAATDCFGTFVAFFTIRNVEAAGKARATLRGVGGAPDAKAEGALDPFWRRSDLSLPYEGDYPASQSCAEQAKRVPARVSVTGRILNRTETYTENGTSYDATVPNLGRIAIFYRSPTNETRCPPAETESGCEGIVVDERGDFKYSWIFSQPVEAAGIVQVFVGGKMHNFTVDPAMRLAVARIEVSGRGPPTNDAPALPLVAVLGAALAAALVARRRRA